MRFSLNGAPQDCQGMSDSPNLLWYLRNVARTTSVKICNLSRALAKIGRAGGLGATL